MSLSHTKYSPGNQASIDAAIATKQAIARERTVGIFYELQNTVIRRCDETIRLVEVYAKLQRDFEN